MKPKKLTALLSAAAIAAGAAYPLSAGAIYRESSEEEYKASLETLTEVDDYGLFAWVPAFSTGAEDYTAYYNTETGSYTVISDAEKYIALSFSGTEAYNKAAAAVEAYNSENGTSIKLSAVSHREDGETVTDGGEIYGIGDEDAKAVSEIFSADALADEIYYYNNRKVITPIYSYDRSNFLTYGSADLDAVKAYIESAGLGCTAEESADGRTFGLVFEAEPAPGEILKTAYDIKAETGAAALSVVQADIIVPKDVTRVDLLAAVDGDANCDGDVNLSDAVLIMQAVANPDAFPLTAQQAFNADISSTGDGVTAADAQYIQSYLLGLAE